MPTAVAVDAVEEVADGGLLAVHVAAPVVDRNAVVVTVPVIEGLVLLVEVGDVEPVRAALDELVPLTAPLQLAIPEAVCEPDSCALAVAAEDVDSEKVSRAEVVGEPDSVGTDVFAADAVEHALPAAVALACAEVDGVNFIVPLVRADKLPLGEPEALRETSGEADIDALVEGERDGAPERDSCAEADTRGDTLAVTLSNDDAVGDEETVCEDVNDGVAKLDRDARGLPLSLSVEETTDVADGVAVAPAPGDTVPAPVAEALNVIRAVKDTSLLSEGELEEDCERAADGVTTPVCDGVAVAVAHILMPALCVILLVEVKESVTNPLTALVALAQPDPVAAGLDVAQLDTVHVEVSVEIAVALLVTAND